jgi:lipoprotein-anchoring transpeptidase ErfK/SrfK
MRGLLLLSGLTAASIVPAATWDPVAINNPQTRETVEPGCAGAAVARAQILLDRAHFSPGEIDGRYRENTRVALYGFQASHKLKMTGIVDGPTWRVLNMDTQPVLTEYRITPEDLRGPFARIPLKIEAQAQLKWLGYGSPEEELGERFHINPDFLSTLNPGKTFRKSGERLMVPHVQRDEGLPMADTIIISRTNRAVTAFTAKGKIIAQFPATTGSAEDPLPLGEWVVAGIQYSPSFFYDPKLFWNPRAFEAKAIIAPGPNNPVGRIWIGLSKQHYGIHGTPAPDRIGQPELRGCIRIANWDVLELAGIVRRGTPVVLRE